MFRFSPFSDFRFLKIVKSKQQKRSIFKSKRRLHAEHKVALKGCGTRQFRHRLRNGKLLFSPARKRVDVCQVCRVWDTTIAKPLQATYSEADKMLGSLCPGYWNGFDLHVPNREEKPEFIRAIIEHIVAHPDKCPNPKNGVCPALELSGELKDRLEKFYLSKVGNWSFHWWYCQEVLNLFSLDLVQPQKTWSYIVHDFSQVP